ncbi:MAG TPA: FlgD immunoglobulin-like domain containing protein, partial [Candidatus Krumholzibacteria bacterium]|nr:FlgD immunoglobulin-like domain containing protein [Candidatus Krumholzibacteria bacterium]
LVDRFEFNGIAQPDYTGETGDLCDTAVTYETQLPGTVWADPYETIFEESGVPVSSLPAWDGNEEIFDRSEVVSVNDGVGQGHEARMTKAAHGFHLYERNLTATRISWVVHDYADLVCLQVNGDQPQDWHAAATLEDLPADPAPGVTLSVTTTTTADGTAALLVLDGPVQYFAFGGLSLDMDNVCFELGMGPVIGACDLGTGMEQLALGQTWSSANSSPGDVAFFMGSVPVRLEQAMVSGGPAFDRVEVTPGLPSFHDGKVLSLTDANVVFDMTGMGVAEFRVDVRAGIGFENLRVNGGSLFMVDITNIPATVAPGITAVLSLAPDGFSQSVGRLVLTGPIETVRIGGDDLLLDNVCVRLDNRHTGVDTAAAPALLGPLSAHPNPFNPSTTVDLRLEAAARATVTIHDAAGRLVRTLADGDLPAGSHALRWDGRDRHGAAAAAGVYFARAVVGGETRVAKLALIK